MPIPNKFQERLAKFQSKCEVQGENSNPARKASLSSSMRAIQSAPSLQRSSPSRAFPSRAFPAEKSSSSSPSSVNEVWSATAHQATQGATAPKVVLVARRLSSARSVTPSTISNALAVRRKSATYVTSEETTGRSSNRIEEEEETFICSFEDQVKAAKEQERSRKQNLLEQQLDDEEDEEAFICSFEDQVKAAMERERVRQQKLKEQQQPQRRKSLAPTEVKNGDVVSQMLSQFDMAITKKKVFEHAVDRGILSSKDSSSPKEDLGAQSTKNINKFHVAGTTVTSSIKISTTVIDQSRSCGNENYTGDCSFTSFEEQMKAARQREAIRRKATSASKVLPGGTAVSVRDRLKTFAPESNVRAGIAA